MEYGTAHEAAGFLGEDVSRGTFNALGERDDTDLRWSVEFESCLDRLMTSSIEVRLLQEAQASEDLLDSLFR